MLGDVCTQLPCSQAHSSEFVIESDWSDFGSVHATKLLSVIFKATEALGGAPLIL